MTLRVAFMGTPDFAVPTLEAVLEAGHDVVGVYTRAAAAAGRGLALRPSPVQVSAERHGLPVRSPASLRREAEVAALAGLGADLAVVVAYGLLLPGAVLAIPRHGCLNLHASCLPRWRGAAPIHRAVMAGDARTAVAVMRMEETLDTGPVGLTVCEPIGPDATTGELHDRLAVRGAALMVEALSRLENGTLGFTPQEQDGVTYARKIGNEEAAIDWSRSADALHDQVRGLSPWPGAFFTADLGRGPERVKVLRAERSGGGGTPGTLLEDGAVACGTAALRPLVLQRSGKAAGPAAAFWRGARLAPGTRLAVEDPAPQVG